MKTVIINLSFLLFISAVIAQKETFDLVTYNAPKGWEKEQTNDLVSYTYVDKKDNSWCRIAIFKNIASLGNIEADFKREWDSLVVKQYHATRPPQISIEHAEGWDIKSGATNFTFNKDETAVVLTTFSGYGICLSIIAITPYQRYFKDLEDLMASIELQTPNINQNSTNTLPDGIPLINGNSSFTFTTTNFDDGWTAIVQKDWVEVTKGGLKVLLHYPNDNIKAANTDLDVLCAAAWNVLVAPRYSNIQNYQLTPGVIEYERPYFAQAELTDNASGKQVFVALFKKGTGWMEFISPDKNSFLKNFGVDITTINYATESAIWESLKRMANYNKFAIAQSDFSGKWSDKFSSNTYYANVYTGASAGMSSYTSTQSFEFSGNNYNWHLVAANSYGGKSEFGQSKGKGVFKVANNWQIHFSEMEGKPKTFDAYFSAIKNGRILWLNETNNRGSGIYTGFSKQ
tara:strand:+ start:15551 stop:16924 length:1374 start_codon:yes stop_codon:yes gene_type:complete